MATQQRVLITYINESAFFTCDCGEKVIIHQLLYGFESYTGSCSNCKLEWRLFYGIISSSKPKSF